MSNQNQFQINNSEESVLLVLHTPDGNIFLADEVCKALGLDIQALADLGPDDKFEMMLGSGQISSEGTVIEEPKKVTMLNEAGLYSLILKSSGAQAAAFKRFITHKLLPFFLETDEGNLSSMFLSDIWEQTERFSQVIGQTQKTNTVEEGSHL